MHNDSKETKTFIFKYINKNADINFSMHNAFLEEHSSGMVKFKRLERLIILKDLGASKPKGLKQDRQNISSFKTCTLQKVHSVK